MHVEGISPGGTETGLPAVCARCQGHRHTEEALLVPRCLRPAGKPRGALFNPPTPCIYSAGVPLTGEGIAMTEQEEREEEQKDQNFPFDFHIAPEHRNNLTACSVLATYFCGYLLA